MERGEGGSYEEKADVAHGMGFLEQDGSCFVCVSSPCAGKSALTYVLSLKDNITALFPFVESRGQHYVIGVLLLFPSL